MELTATILRHEGLTLEPFDERHRAGLIEAASAPSIWRHMPFDAPARGYGVWFDHLRREQAHGRWLPFAVVAPGQRIVGQSCYLSLRSEDRGVEIGGTWYAPEAQGTAVNPIAKLLLLGHAFDSGAQRVEFKTDALNARSRAALLKLGCSFEGVFRRHMLRPDGTWRDSAYFSIIREEWPSVRAQLETRIAALVQ
ncbi:MAG: GNAT family N-acetyltransferase [Hyphomonadaceae bacterium]